LAKAVQRYLDQLDARWDNDTITVLIPEFVVEKWYQNLLHNQSALALKLALLRRDGTVVTSVPHHVRSVEQAGRDRPKARRGAAGLTDDTGWTGTCSNPDGGLRMLCARRQTTTHQRCSKSFTS